MLLKPCSSSISITTTRSSKDAVSKSRFVAVDDDLRRSVIITETKLSEVKLEIDSAQNQYYDVECKACVSEYCIASYEVA